jgi:cell division protein FtsQ
LRVKKRIRKNRYKNKSVKQKQRFNLPVRSCCKIAAGIFVTSVISLALILAHDILTQCDYFRVSQIEIEGTTRLSRDMVLDQSGIRGGDNILSVSINRARTRLIGHPWITDAEIIRNLPAGITIKIFEHKPLAVLDMGRLFLINHNGEIFKEADQSDLNHLPFVIGLDYSDLNIPGEPRSLSLDAVMNVLTLNRQTGNIIFDLFSIKTVEIDREIGLTLHSSGRIKSVRLGYNNYQYKYKRLKDIVLYLDKESRFKTIDSIDLAKADRIVIRPEKDSLSAVKKKEV